MAPLEELDDSTRRTRKLARGRFVVNCSIPITNTKGLYLYPGFNTTPSRPRLQHLLPKINTMASCPSHTRHQFIRFFIFNPHHRAFPNAFLFQPWNSSSAEWWRTPDRRRLYRMLSGKPSVEWCSSTKLGPQVSLFPVPIFGVNRCSLKAFLNSAHVIWCPAGIMVLKFSHHISAAPRS
jgi:hypothetical protein